MCGSCFFVFLLEIVIELKIVSVFSVQLLIVSLKLMLKRIKVRGSYPSVRS